MVLRKNLIWKSEGFSGRFALADKIVLIDGHSILNRAFYGVPDLTNAEGLHTNAIYGFLNIMFKILEEEKPQFLAVAFDVSAPTFRHEIYKEYKGTRKPMAEELRQQVPVMKEVLKAMGIPVLEKAGLEADDILGTLAKRSARAGMEVALLSGDRDLLQIAEEHIKIKIPKTKGGKTEIENYYARDVFEKYQVTPEQFVELKALMGDTSDNIPGVPKVGEKTATELMVTYHSLDGIYDNLENISKKSIRESLAQNRELAELSKVLATINTDCEIEFSAKDAEITDFYTDEAYDWFVRLEFKNMLSNFSKEKSLSVAEAEQNFFEIKDEKALKSVWKEMKEEFMFLRIWVGDRQGEYKASLDGQLSFFTQEEENQILCAAFAERSEKIFFVSSEAVGEQALRDFLTTCQEKKRLISYRVKDLYSYYEEVLRGADANAVAKRFYDVLVGAYLLNPLKNDYTISDIAKEYNGIILPDYETLFGKKDWETAYEERREEFVKYACCEILGLALSASAVQEKLKSAAMFDLMENVEMPLSYVLFAMEREGVRVDAKQLKAYGEELEKSIRALEARIHTAAGKEFNINSPKQLGEILFEEMQIPGGKKTKTGFSTSAEVLEKLAPEYPFVKDILEYRTVAKLKSTYADGLAAYIEADGRIRTNFNQTITATGRISSTEPNLQNIPMRMELGRKIRKVFIPKDGYVFVDADYSQIELRILAALAGDEELIDAYRSNKDIHRSTASKVFHVPFEEVTDLQRRNAKAVNFGIVYGISSFGLSQDLSITKKEAQKYIEDYFATYPGIKKYLENTKEFAKENGYSLTYFGRRRPIPELKSSNFMQRSFGERVAMNAPIQGTAADIMKIAMLNVFARLQKDCESARLILQVHDELVVEVKEEEKDKVLLILEEEMRSAADLAVSLEVEAHWGKDWYEAK